MATPTQTPTESKPSAAKSFFFDPFKIWRQAFEVSEQLLTSTIDKALNTTQFAEANGKLMELILLSMKTARGNVKTLLHTLNFPSREDSARLGQLIIALEEKVDQVHDRLDQLEDTLAAVRAELAAAKAGARADTGEPGEPGDAGIESDAEPAVKATKPRSSRK